MLRARNISVIQSQAHTSHVTQAFDDRPARESKRAQRAALPMIRMSNVSDDDQLLLTMLAGDRAIDRNVWIDAFRNVNLHPDHRFPLQVRLSKIHEHLEAAGESIRFLHHGYAPTPEEIKVEVHTLCPPPLSIYSSAPVEIVEM